MKYKVGDMIKMKEDLEVGKFYGEIIFLYPMVKFKGKIGKIEQITCNGNYCVEGLGDYIYSQEMLEPIAENIADSDENTDEVVDTLVETIDKNGQKDKKSTVKSGLFTKKDFKFGDIVTLRNEEKGIVSGEKIVYSNEQFDFIKEFDNDFKYLGKNKKFDIMKVQRLRQFDGTFYKYETLYKRKEEILTKEEKEYLKNMINAFEVKILFIRKDSDDFQIKLGIAETFYPTIKLNLIKYKFEGMEDGKEYTLKDLGL